MIVYNTTFVVNTSIVDSFLEFMRHTYNTDAIKGGTAKNSRLSQMMSSEDETVVNFAYQCEINNLDDLDIWYAEAGQILNEKLVAMCADQVIGFSTLMEVIDL